jgi:hypothetical protein
MLSYSKYDWTNYANVKEIKDNETREKNGNLSEKIVQSLADEFTERNQILYKRLAHV